MAIAQNRALALSALGTASNALNIAKAESAFQIDVRPDLYLDYAGERTIIGTGLLASKKWATGTRASVEGIAVNASGDGNVVSQKILRVEIAQPLFRSFGSLVQREAVVQARHDYLSSQRSLEMQKNALILSVVASYENILQLERQVLAEQASSDRMDKLVRLARAKELLGRTTRVETLRTELLRGQALYRLESIRESLLFEQSAFAELLGANPNTKYVLKPTVQLELDIPPLEDAVRVAMDNRLDYAQRLQDKEDAGRGVRIANRNLWPDLSIVVGKNWATGASVVTASKPLNRWSAGLALDMNLNLEAERAALEQARLYGASADLEVGILELAITREVGQQRAICRRAQAELKIAERNKDMAFSRRKLAQQMFDLGRSDQFSVTDAEETYLQAENQWLASRSSASLAGYQFLYISGTLMEAPQALKPGGFRQN